MGRIKKKFVSSSLRGCVMEKVEMIDRHVCPCACGELVTDFFSHCVKDASMSQNSFLVCVDCELVEGKSQPSRC